MTEPRIIPFSPDHAPAWAALNTAWLLEGGFEIEAKDRKVIDDPKGAILDASGYIFMVERDGQAVGCCALMAMDDGGFEVAKADLRPVMTRRLTVTGSTMRPRTTAQKAELAKALREKVWPLLDAGRCAPPIFKVFPLREAAAAHALMESSRHIGKIVLRVAEA